MTASERRARIEELEAKVAELTATVARLTAAEASAGTTPPSDDRARSSRRNLLKLAGATALGSAAAVVGTPGRAAAADDDPIRIAQTTATDATSADVTVAVYSNLTAPSVLGPTPGTTVSANLFLFRDSRDPTVPGSADASSFPAVLAGYAYRTVANGIYGFTQMGGAGVLGSGIASATSGVFGRNTNPTAGAGAGVRAASAAGPNVQLEPTQTGAPISGAWAQGAIVADNAGSLWYCVTAGAPGTWKRLTSASAAGVFHAITPVRVYDSRAPQPAPGFLPTGQSRLVSVADARNINSGVITTANVVPAGATAITANVSVVNTVSAGFVTVNPGGDNVPKAATVNWFAANQILNNGVTLALNNNRQVTVVAGGIPGSGTDVVIDVTGYFA